MEWEVVTVLIALVGLGAVIAKPMISLTRELATLNATVKTLAQDMDGITRRNSESHDRLFKRADAADAAIADHETRICVIEDWRKTSER